MAKQWRDYSKLLLVWLGIILICLATTKDPHFQIQYQRILRQYTKDRTLGFQIHHPQ